MSMLEPKLPPGALKPPPKSWSTLFLKWAPYFLIVLALLILVVVLFWQLTSGGESQNRDNTTEIQTLQTAIASLEETNSRLESRLNNVDTEQTNTGNRLVILEAKLTPAPPPTPETAATTNTSAAVEVTGISLDITTPEELKPGEEVTIEVMLQTRDNQPFDQEKQVQLTWMPEDIFEGLEPTLSIQAGQLSASSTVNIKSDIIRETTIELTASHDDIHASKSIILRPTCAVSNMPNFQLIAGRTFLKTGTNFLNETNHLIALDAETQVYSENTDLSLGRWNDVIVYFWVENDKWQSANDTEGKLVEMVGVMPRIFSSDLITGADYPNAFLDGVKDYSVTLICQQDEYSLVSIKGDIEANVDTTLNNYLEAIPDR